MKFYVVTAPPSVRGIYDTWPACEAVVAGVARARYQSVTSRSEAEAILRGEVVTLPVGVYAFIDGNEQGGVGVVFVKQRAGAAPVAKEISTSVAQVFKSATIAGLDSPAAALDALQRLRNILAELAALYFAIQHIAPGTALTLVHDYDGLAHWMQGRWLMRDALVQEIIAACQRAVSARELSIAYYHQLAHQPISFNEFARYNARGCARDCRRSNLMRVLGGHLMTALPRALIAVVISLGLAAAPGALGQDRVLSPNAGLPYLGVNGTFTLDQQELAARDPRNPKRVVFEKMERFSFFDDLQGTQPIAKDCVYVHRGPAGDPYYYPDRAKTSIWELFELQSGEQACRRFSYVALRAPHGNPVHMHLRYGDERSSFQSLLAMSDGPEDKTKLDPWWSVYCAEGRSGCDK